MSQACAVCSPSEEDFARNGGFSPIIDQSDRLRAMRSIVIPIRRLFRALLLLSTALLSGCSPHREAQTLTPHVAKQVDSVFAKWDRADSPGCALGVNRGGQIVYKRGYGMEDLNEDVHITPGTVFHVASMSKQFTAASIVLLAQQGKISLDDDVRKYIPELPN